MHFPAEGSIIFTLHLNWNTAAPGFELSCLCFLLGFFSRRFQKTFPLAGKVSICTWCSPLMETGRSCYRLFSCQSDRNFRSHNMFYFTEQHNSCRKSTEGKSQVLLCKQLKEGSARNGSVHFSPHMPYVTSL